MPRPILRELSVEECFQLLGLASVGRVGVTIDALPAVLPVNFILHDGAVVFRTVPGTKLNAATASMVVAFEVDHYGANAASPDGWSVLLRGVAQEITDPAELDAVRALPLESWAFDGQADRFVKIEPVLVTGRRVTREE
jgi:nitroimidazol reductase NimA-like FMN-containing flavoprotein (pyridoxamine 5'-phosphate oxidase superfamily)